MVEHLYFLLFVVITSTLITSPECATCSFMYTFLAASSALNIKKKYIILIIDRRQTWYQTKQVTAKIQIEDGCIIALTGLFIRFFDNIKKRRFLVDLSDSNTLALIFWPLKAIYHFNLVSVATWRRITKVNRGIW